MATVNNYYGFGQLCGTSDDGGQTFVGYGRVRGTKVQNELQITGEVLITENTNFAADHAKTGLSISAILTALGIAGSFTFKGNQHTHLGIFNQLGYRFGSASTDGAFEYGYGMVLVSYLDPDILIAGRNYDTDGSIGGWASNLRGPYEEGMTWKFSFNLVEA